MENFKSEITLWLKSVFSEDSNISDFTINIEGSSEKGDGFLGDIVFVQLSKKSHPPKELNLVLKCSKRSESLRTKTPVKQAFENEIYIYDKVLPAFTKFQQARGVTDIFNTLPKYYGHFIGKDMEVIVFENLKKNGYDLWDKRKPMTMKHVEMVVEEYGKWHALSVAMRDQLPDQFQELAQGVINVWGNFCEATNMTKIFKLALEESIESLKGELCESITKEWSQLLDQLEDVMVKTPGNPAYFSVISHGDCWNNNFLFKTDGDICMPSKVSILDWQLANLSSPALDLSHFIYTCAPKDALNNLDEIFMKYYASFSSFLKKLGSDAENVYPFPKLMADWDKIVKFGVIMSILVAKICLTDKEDVPDIKETVDQGHGFSDAFMVTIKNTSTFNKRIGYIVEHAVKRGITKPN